ncbi:related to methyltransferase [Phialocephala subalpina]|uniref:Related to methyltransferase n=1 Tax=Phialocephala subalpina TaxID=576137 RepID=A0A1L7WSE6_9HELO|nr:related to methyltransferase [Phialocephala subalpina]
MPSSDSGVEGDDDRRSTKSLSKSVAEGVLENGRRYQSYAPGKYPLPNDEEEQDRLDQQHHLFGLTFEKNLCTCPVNKANVHRVLDAGTGTGIWAMDFADDNPHAHVIGIDLSPIQPESVPPNWLFAFNFDLIHCRMLTFSISDWPRFFQQSFENLALGGYIEVIDIAFPIETDDESLPADSLLLDWSSKLIEASTKAGMPLDSAKLHKQRLKDAGFKEIVEKKYVWPQYIWAKEKKFQDIGVFSFSVMSKIESISMALFTQHLGWTKSQVHEYSISVKAEMRKREIHAYWPIYVVYGRKPVSPQV